MLRASAHAILVFASSYGIGIMTKWRISQIFDFSRTYTKSIMDITRNSLVARTCGKLLG